MIFFKRSFFTLFFASLFIFSSAQSNLLNHIPSDATFVVSMNLNNLNSKVNLRQLKEYDFYNMALGQLSSGMGDGSEQVMNILADPNSIGLDVMAQTYVFGNLSEDKNEIGMLLNLSDASKFTDFLKSMVPQMFEGESYSKLPNYHLLNMDDDVKFAWNGNMAFFGGINMDKDINWDNESEIEERARIKSEFSADWVTGTMNRTSENSIQSNSKFRMANAKPADMRIWFDYSFISKNMNEEMMKDMPGDLGPIKPEMIMGILSSFYEDTYLSMSMNFDKGRISFDLDQYAKPEMLALSRKTLDQKFNKKLARYIRGDQLLGYYSLSMNTKNAQTAYKDLIYGKLKEIPGYGEMAVGALDILGIFLDENAWPGLFSGDMIVAATGMQKVTRTVTEIEYDDDFNATEIQKTVDQEIPEVTMVWTHGSKADWMKFIRLGLNSSVLETAGNYYKVNIPGGEIDAYIALKDDMLFITNSDDLVKNHLSKGYKKKNRIGKKHCEMMSQNAMAFYWDIPNTLSVVGNEAGEAMGMGEFMNMGKQKFESISMKTSREVVNSSNTNFSINFSKKDENSLKQIFEMINEVFMGMMGGSNT